jgi:hypothetical protein
MATTADGELALRHAGNSDDDGNRDMVLDRDKTGRGNQGLLLRPVARLARIEYGFIGSLNG